MSIAVIVETGAGSVTPASLECLAEGRELAEALGMAVTGWLVGDETAVFIDTVTAHGAQSVVLVEHEALKEFSAEGWLAALEAPLKAASPRLILAPDSSRGRAWLPRLALRWPAPIASGCSLLRADGEERIEITRPLYNGLQREKLLYAGPGPLLATLLPGARGSEPAELDNRPATAVSLTPTLSPAEWRDRTIERLPADPDTVAISEAERIVSGGLGVGSLEKMDLLRQLAHALGAAVGGTRAIADRGWLPHERYIGSTGKVVTPQLYLALGISGASQHTVGMSDSRVIVAVNIDRAAPIFALADLGIVGDLDEILPALLRRLENGEEGLDYE